MALSHGYERGRVEHRVVVSSKSWDFKSISLCVAFLSTLNNQTDIKRVKKENDEQSVTFFAKP